MLAADDLLAPRGELQPALFPMVDTQAVATMVDEYLQAGYSEAAAAGFTDQPRLDRIARAYAYWRIYDGVVQRIAASPMSLSLNDKGSSTYTTEQLRVLTGKANYWQSEYMLVVVPDAPAEASGASTGATPNRFVW